MGQIIDEPMSADDLEKYLAGDGDFAFEMKVLKALNILPFKCEHGGTYIDPVTKLPREYDIRAEARDGFSSFYLAVECKNLKANSPLLVSCVPRRGSEARHDVVVSFPGSIWPDIYGALETTFQTITIECGGDEPYPVRGANGKACVQVGKDKNGEFQIIGKSVYEKWAQALASAHDLIERASELHPKQCTVRYSVVLPILVVPDGMLWSASYNVQGDMVGAPRQVDRASYFVNRPVDFGVSHDFLSYNISHIEFVTFKGLIELATWITSESARACLTPEDDLDKELKKRMDQAEREGRE
jgi:hypothetical protein